MLQNQATPLKRSRILTDLSGPNDTVIIESEVESIDDYFAMLKTLFDSSEFTEMQAALSDDHPYQGSKRTFYTIEDTFE